VSAPSENFSTALNLANSEKGEECVV